MTSLSKFRRGEGVIFDDLELWKIKKNDQNIRILAKSQLYKLLKFQTRRESQDIEITDN